jgi:hypothetical protein
LHQPHIFYILLSTPKPSLPRDSSLASSNSWQEFSG